jgi:ferredoxin
MLALPRKRSPDCGKSRVAIVVVDLVRFGFIGAGVLQVVQEQLANLVVRHRTPPAANPRADGTEASGGTLERVIELSAVNRIRIEVDRDLCIGSGDCVASEPDVFFLDDDGKAVVLDPDAAAEDDILEAARNCPVSAIFVIGEDGDLYP